MELQFHYPIRNVENCTIPGYHAASSANILRAFRDEISVPASGVQDSPQGIKIPLRGSRIILDSWTSEYGNR